MTKYRPVEGRSIEDVKAGDLISNPNNKYGPDFYEVFGVARGYMWTSCSTIKSGSVDFIDSVKSCGWQIVEPIPEPNSENDANTCLDSGDVEVSCTANHDPSYIGRNLVKSIRNTGRLLREPHEKPIGSIPEPEIETRWEPLWDGQKNRINCRVTRTDGKITAVELVKDDGPDDKGHKPYIRYDPSKWNPKDGGLPPLWARIPPESEEPEWPTVFVKEE